MPTKVLISNSMRRCYISCRYNNWKSLGKSQQALMRNSTLCDVGPWLLGTMNYKASHTPLRSPANDSVQLSVALSQHGT